MIVACSTGGAVATFEKMLEAEVESGLSAIKGAQIINGGGAAALLAVMAEALKTPDSALAAKAAMLANGWICFMVGLFLSLVALACRYFAQAKFTAAYPLSGLEGDELHKIGQKFRVGAIGTAIVSALVFLGGSIVVYCAML